MNDIWDGVLIGGAGGAIAGITVGLVRYVHENFLEVRHKKRVHSWLCENTSDEDGKEYRSTRAIASWTNLTEDRVRYICGIDKRIYLSTGPDPDKGSLYKRFEPSVYEKRGVRTL